MLSFCLVITDFFVFTCTIIYAEGQLIVGYKSGGVYAFSPYDTYSMGDLEALPVSDVAMFHLSCAQSTTPGHMFYESIF